MREYSFEGKGSFIDLILTITSSNETDLSDYHHLISSMMKTTFKKEESKVLSRLPKNQKIFAVIKSHI